MLGEDVAGGFADLTSGARVDGDDFQSDFAMKC